ncbi:hypothetical protein ABZ883_14740 [Streptomyces sp. NPDC046977]|uniref:hypothetical protein n=1 Tax=Streptomyces sp. NPDC046977 TaxID=3154703 RepID=UPI0034090B42
MPNITRVFTTDELEEVGVPFELDGEGCATEIVNEPSSSGRWHETRRLIFRAPDDGHAYLIRYRVGLTEQQDVEPFDGDTVTATRVEEREVTLTRWEPVQA